MHYKQRILLVSLLPITSFVSILVIYKHVEKGFFDDKWSDKNELFCHELNGKSLPDISDNPPSGDKRNMFFLETSCHSYKKRKIVLKARQACAVESAAKMNPDMDVYILFAAPATFVDDNSESDRLIKVLTSYSNIKMFHFNIERYIRNSPVEILWKTGKIQASKYPVAHTSDILRLLTLWKFGGIYLDLDTIALKSFRDFPENFGGAESDNLVANGVMGFSRYGKGRQYIDECLEDLSKNFRGDEWNYNGPKLITRNIFSHCPEFDVKMLVRFGICEEFRIYPPSSFYMIPYSKWEWFFDGNLTDAIESYVEDRSYLIHVWNKLSYNRNISKTEFTVPYLRLASKYCPGVVEQLDEFF